MTVLVRLPNHVGDACMALPALHLLRVAGVRCTLVGRAWGASLFEGFHLPFVAIEGRLLHDIVVVRAAPRPIEDTLHGLVLPNSIGSALLFLLADVPSAGLATAHRGWLLRWPSPDPGERHEVERFFAAARAALRAWGFAADQIAPPAALQLPLTEGQRRAAESVRHTGQVAGPYALVAPVATGLHRGRVKHWAHFSQLTPLLQARGLSVVAAPPPTEVDAARAALPGVTILPPVPLGVFAALAEGAAVVVANDSGTSHVAAAVGARQVTIFGVTDRVRTGPWSPRAVCVGANGAWPTLGEVDAAVDEALQRP